MRKDTHYLASIEGKKATLRLFGALGKDVDGHWMAQDLYWAGEEFEEIDLLINSEGGSILQGLSIISAIENTGAQVNAKIMGVAASMAGVIAMRCDSISMVDFGRLMIHDPHMGGKKPNAKQQKAIDNMRAMLQSIYMDRTGLSEDEIAKIMKEETWLTAEDALDQGFIDQIIETNKKAKLSPAASMEEILALASNEYQSKNPENMSKHMISLSAILGAGTFEGLGDEATEEQVLAAIQSKDSTIADLKAQLEKAPKQETIDNLQAQLDEVSKAKATLKVETLIKEGRLEESKKEALIEAALKDESSFDALISAVPQSAPRVSAHLDGDGKNNSRKDWTFHDYEQKDPEALAKMQKEDPEAFTALFEAHFGPIND